MYKIGIDVGSKTLKVAVIDERGALVCSRYLRHHSNVRKVLADALHELAWTNGDISGSVAVTGSAGIDIARSLGVPFVQEVVATTHAVQTLIPDASAFIELGGEDAKVVYLDKPIEQRMNGSCAGGTGAFIDAIAHMLGVRTQEMSRLALGSQRTYPIASRCAVFAQSDVRPLLNAGASKADIAASAFEAVVQQTLGGLACGRPLRGTVVFLGGPLEYLPALVMAFRRALGLDATTGIKPPDAHLMTVRGAALLADRAAAEGRAPHTMSLSGLEEQVRTAPMPDDDLERLPPLLAGEGARERFAAAHDEQPWPRVRLFDYEGPLYLGIDAGSTALKLVALTKDGKLAYHDWRPVSGDVLGTARDLLQGLYAELSAGYRSHEPSTWIAHATVTGYGEDLLKAALGIDSGVVETTAHLTAAHTLYPDLSFLLDIGGQDIKALWVREGQITEAVLNEACSSGCGAFVASAARSLGMGLEEFSHQALLAKRPVDLGIRCTVFMTSRARHAQKVGAAPAEIAAGVAYSVVKNALYRIIGADKAEKLGGRVVVQGGTFASDAVLRAFELVADVHACRPADAQLMGALGCALVALQRAGADAKPGASTILGREELAQLDPKRTSQRCPGCPNACALTVLSFGSGAERRVHVRGNRCPRAYQYLDGDAGEAGVCGAAAPVSAKGPGVGPAAGAGAVPPAASAADARRGPQSAPNVVALEQALIESCATVRADGPRGQVAVGLPCVLEGYEATPFWHAFFEALGFSVIMPNELIERRYKAESAESIPSESVCHPAKLTHVRAYALAAGGATAIFMPRYERGSRCPVSCWYADALADNLGTVQGRRVAVVSPTLTAMSPFALVSRDDDLKMLQRAVAGLAPTEAPVSPSDFSAALHLGIEAQRSFERLVMEAGRQALAWVEADPAHRHGIVLAGRPYHMDRALLHGIDEVICDLGMAAIPRMAVRDKVREARNQAQSRRREREANLWSSGIAATERGGRTDGRGFGPQTDWKQAKHLVGTAQYVLTDPNLDLVALRSFGCKLDDVTVEDVRDLLVANGRPYTGIKIDEIVDNAHIRIRLRTLAEAIELRKLRGARAEEERPISDAEQTAHPQPSDDRVEPLRSAAPLHLMEAPLGPEDLEEARRHTPPDICFTAAALTAHCLRALEEHPDLEHVEVPAACRACVVDALPHIVNKQLGRCPTIHWREGWPTNTRSTCAPAPRSPHAVSRPRIGIVGNPLLCFDPYMNDDLVRLISQLGADPVLPDPRLMYAEDVRYLEQLAAFVRQDVDHVIYLLSFGCLKGHVQARGALHEFQRRFPGLPVTVIDYDPEGSALNRENRVRLAVEAARQSRNQRISRMPETAQAPSHPLPMPSRRFKL